MIDSHAGLGLGKRLSGHGPTAVQHSTKSHGAACGCFRNRSEELQGEVHGAPLIGKDGVVV